MFCPRCPSFLSMYESRILGSHHGLLSSFALETMTLFILNCFHTSLHTPLQVRGVNL